MSTNFYFETPKGHPLAVYGRLHIGKRSGGWSFSFHGYSFEGSRPVRVSHEVAPGLSVMLEQPALPALKLTSWSEWKDLILRSKGQVYDEYEAKQPTASFIKEVESDLNPVSGRWGKAAIPLLNSFDESKKRGDFHDPERQWKDSAGYSFSSQDFS